jgi:CO/xanthine dehydrogenase Mo-binding subunit
VDRVDGPLKVTGAAPYPSDFDFPHLAHAALVRSTIAAGRIRAMDTVAAAAVPGVLAIITHQNAPPLARGPEMWIGEGVPPIKSPPAPLQDDRSITANSSPWSSLSLRMWRMRPLA